LQIANSVLLRAKTEGELFQSMCDAIVTIGRYRMATVAIASQDDEKAVRHVAMAGVDKGYLEDAAITWGDGPRGQGPTGMAIKSGTIQVNQDFEANPKMAPWRAAALSRGFRASISLPLKAADRVFGALTIYAAQSGAFDSEEVSLLADFANDISYGVTAVRARSARASV